MSYKTALFKAACAGDTERVQVYLDKGADINSKDGCHNDYTALHHSVRKGHLELSLDLIYDTLSATIYPSKRSCNRNQPSQTVNQPTLPVRFVSAQPPSLAIEW